MRGFEEDGLQSKDIISRLISEGSGSSVESSSSDSWRSCLLEERNASILSTAGSKERVGESSFRTADNMTSVLVVPSNSALR